MGNTRLVASVAGETTEDLLRRARLGTAGADVVELRVDGVSDPSLETLRDEIDRPLILTCRSAAEGGVGRRDEAERLPILERAATLGFDYVDVEIAALDAPFPKGDAKLILSHHDFDGPPAEPDALIDRALELGADVVKIAARVDSLADALALAKLGARVRDAGASFVPVAMGPAGASARVLAARLGAAFGYATAGGGRPTGPGQLTLEEMTGLYRFRAIDDATEIYGIVGTHALSSRSPAMHNGFFAKLERDAVYVPFVEEDLPKFIEAAKTIGVSGLSVTLPFKEAILPMLDEVDETASRIGAVNTVTVTEDGRWLGTNTDVSGVTVPLRRLGEWKGKKAVVLGAGGAARAAVFALGGPNGLGASVSVLARREERAAALADEVGGHGASLDALGATSWDLLVNATPIGSVEFPSEQLVPAELDPERCVFDMVTVPEWTDLVVRARAAQASVVTGIEMLAAQAVEQAASWTGERSSTEAFEVSARGKLEKSRYSRQVLFKEIGEPGQERLGSRRVLVVGVGALGSVSSEMIVRAGVKLLRIVDRDYVDESNLQRQSLFDEDDFRQGLPKAVAAERKLARINSDVTIEAHVADVHAGNIRALFEGVDLVIDGTDNFETRYLLNDASVHTGVPWIYAACVGSYGMSFVVVPGVSPCLRCFMEEEPAPGTSPTCDTAGVIAPVVHAVASFQVTEALKFLSGRHDVLSREILSLDVWRGQVERFRPARRRDQCPACGRRELSYLDGDGGGSAVTLCGRNAVQVRPSRVESIALRDVAARLDPIGSVIVNPYLLRAQLDGCELVLFKDGRAIVHGTEDPAEAKSLYARYVGS